MSINGRVIKSTGSWYRVSCDDGSSWNCRLRGKFKIDGIRSTNPVAVGDFVTIEPENDGENALITAIAERNNIIVRKATKLSKASHIIASNLDQAILVATIALPRTSTGFIDRFLVTAEAYHIPVIVLFNKHDLFDEKSKEKADRLIEVYNHIGYKSYAVSAFTGFQLDKLKADMSNKTTLLSGHSGVGKSALINALDPSMKLREGDISLFSNKGKHTTTFAEMHQLAFGGWIVDTPGIKEFGLFDLEKETLAQRFPEMRALMSQCRYANCTHLHEPGCAVKLARDQGEIDEVRYRNYCGMMNDEIVNE